MSRESRAGYGLMCFLFGLFLGSLGGCLYGWVRGEFGERQRVFQRDTDLIEPALAADADFRTVKVRMSSRGPAGLEGSVPSADAQARLRKEMVRLFGEQRGESLAANVSVQEP